MNSDSIFKLLRFDWLQEDNDLQRIQLSNHLNHSKQKNDIDSNIYLNEPDISDLDLEDLCNDNNVIRKHMDVNFFMTNKNENDINNISNKLLNKELTTFLRRK